METRRRRRRQPPHRHHRPHRAPPAVAGIAPTARPPHLFQAAASATSSPTASPHHADDIVRRRTHAQGDSERGSVRPRRLHGQRGNPIDRDSPKSLLVNAQSLLFSNRDTGLETPRFVSADGRTVLAVDIQDGALLLGPNGRPRRVSRVRTAVKPLYTLKLGTGENASLSMTENTPLALTLTTPSYLPPFGRETPLGMREVGHGSDASQRDNSDAALESDASDDSMTKEDSEMDGQPGSTDGLVFKHGLEDFLRLPEGLRKTLPFFKARTVGVSTETRMPHHRMPSDTGSATEQPEAQDTRTPVGLKFSRTLPSLFAGTSSVCDITAISRITCLGGLPARAAAACPFSGRPRTVARTFVTRLRPKSAVGVRLGGGDWMETTPTGAG